MSLTRSGRPTYSIGCLLTLLSSSTMKASLIGLGLGPVYLRIISSILKTRGKFLRYNLASYSQFSCARNSKTGFPITVCENLIDSMLLEKYIILRIFFMRIVNSCIVQRGQRQHETTVLTIPTPIAHPTAMAEAMTVSSSTGMVNSSPFCHAPRSHATSPTATQSRSTVAEGGARVPARGAHGASSQPP